MRELEDRKARDGRMKKTLESQARRIKRREELEVMSKMSKNKVKQIKEVQGNKYMHNVLENDYQQRVVIPEIVRQKAILDEQKLAYKKNYAAIQQQRDAYSQVMVKSSENRRAGSNRSRMTLDSSVMIKDSQLDGPVIKSQSQIRKKTQPSSVRSSSAIEGKKDRYNS